MATLLEYLGTEFAPFDEKFPSAVDVAALSQACMFDVSGIVPPPVAPATGVWGRLRAHFARQAPPVHFGDLIRAEHFDHMFTGLVPEELKRCLYALAASPRFRDVELRAYRSVYSERRRTQFAAMAFTWHDAGSFIGFRGTDTTLTGWHENFDMAWCDEVPSQRLAREYLEEVAPTLPAPVFLGGHSKGGNLALYAALTCSEAVRDRIGYVWALDAPGFRPQRFSDADYARLAGRAARILPAESVVGVLMDCGIESQVVRATAGGIAAHSVFTWEVEESGSDFVRAERLSDFSRGLHDVLDAWVAGMDDARRKQVVEALFAAFAAAGVQDVGAVLFGGPAAARTLMDALRLVSPSQREVITSALGDLAAIAVQRVGREALNFLPWS